MQLGLIDECVIDTYCLALGISYVKSVIGNLFYFVHEILKAVIRGLGETADCIQYSM